MQIIKIPLQTVACKQDFWTVYFRGTPNFGPGCDRSSSLPFLANLQWISAQLQALQLMWSIYSCHIIIIIIIINIIIINYYTFYVADSISNKSLTQSTPHKILQSTLDLMPHNQSVRI